MDAEERLAAFCQGTLARAAARSAARPRAAEK